MRKSRMFLRRRGIYLYEVAFFHGGEVYLYGQVAYFQGKERGRMFLNRGVIFVKRNGMFPQRRCTLVWRSPFFCGEDVY